MPGAGSVACPKPAKGTAKRARRKLRAQERVVGKSVREIVDKRDGYCRLMFADDGSGSLQAVQQLFGACGGPGEWAHVGPGKRFKTRGMAPDERHSTAHSVKLCRVHHQSDRYGYDRGVFAIEYADADKGCDGPLRFVTRSGEQYWEAGAAPVDS